MTHLTRTEWAARLALLLILVGLPGLAFGYQRLIQPRLAPLRTIDIIAAAPEAGGFQPELIRVAAGEPVRLRFSVPDVTHGLAIGPGTGLDFGQLDPGQVETVAVTFDQPGRYTLYCTTWCSPSHWRMRSTIEVFDPAQPDALPPAGPPDPVTAWLAAQGMDIDAPHAAPSSPPQPPSVSAGVTVLKGLGSELPPEMTTPDWQRAHSPSQAYERLRTLGLSETAAWNGVAALWRMGIDPAQQEQARNLYNQNCAACHGEQGDGVGPGAAALAAQGITTDEERAPAAFVDAEKMLGGSSNLYYAKIRRGGMGTGMPAFGPLLSQEETWLLVDYLWTFVFDE